MVQFTWCVVLLAASELRGSAVGCLEFIRALGATTQQQAEARLEVVLHAWEAENASIRDARYSVRRRSPDKFLNRNEIATVQVLILKPDHFRIDLADAKGRPELTIFSDGKRAQFFDFAKRQETVYKLPPGYPESGLADGFLLQRCLARYVQQYIKWPFLGLPVSQLRREYRVSLDKEDDYWSYIYVEPAEGWKSPSDHFQKLRVVLGRRDHRVRQVWFLAPNCDECTWDYEKSEVNVTPSLTPAAIRQGLPSNFQKMDFEKAGAEIAP